MRILITGATGFIGRAIASECYKSGCEIFCLGGLKSKDTESLPNLFQVDITNPDSLEEVAELKNIEVIIHSAGLAHQFGKNKKRDFWQVNVEGTKNIAALGLKLNIGHFILISSVSVYGNADFSFEARQARKSAAVTEDFICRPTSDYAQSKLKAEEEARKICARNGAALTILRLATVIGEGDRGNLSRLIEAVERRKFIWVGKGENYKSLIYKKDVAKACLKILPKTKNTIEIFNVAAEPLKMKEIVSIIASRLDRKIAKIKIPVIFVKNALLWSGKYLRLKKAAEYSETLEKWLSEEVYSGEKFKKEYGFAAETAIPAALGRQVDFYLKNR